MKNAYHHVLYSHDCKWCGEPVGMGEVVGGKKIEIDLKVKCFALIGGRKPFEIARTNMAYAPHADVCKGDSS